MDDKPVVTIRPPSYQPKKVELEEDVSVNATPEEVRATLMRTVKVIGLWSANPSGRPWPSLSPWHRQGARPGRRTGAPMEESGSTDFPVST